MGPREKILRKLFGRTKNNAHIGHSQQTTMILSTENIVVNVLLVSHRG
jgi:hypothetical protein